MKIGRTIIGLTRCCPLCSSRRIERWHIGSRWHIGNKSNYYCRHCNTPFQGWVFLHGIRGASCEAMRLPSSGRGAKCDGRHATGTSRATHLPNVSTTVEGALTILTQHQVTWTRQTAAFQALLAEAERVLTARAQQYVEIKRAVATLRTLITDMLSTPAAPEHVHMTERAIEVLHAHLVTT